MSTRENESFGTEVSANASGDPGASGDISFDLETSVPTDLTVSSVSDDVNSRGRARNKDPTFARYISERKQIITDLYNLKMQLPQKTLRIQQLESELKTRTEDLEEKYRDAVLKNKVTQIKFEAQLKFAEEEARRKQVEMNKNLEKILSKQRHLEETNKQLQEVAGNLKRSIDEIEISESGYSALKNKSANELSLKDYVSLKIYSCVWPLKELKVELEDKVTSLQNNLEKCKKELHICQQVSEKQEKIHFQLRSKFDLVNLQLNKTRNQVEYGNFAQENFYRVREERDRFEVKSIELSEKLQGMQATLNLIIQERDDLKNEGIVLKRQESLLQKECDRYTTQIGTLTRQLGESQDQATRLTLQLNHTKQSQEEMLNRLLSVRKQCKSEYEIKLQQEKEKLNNSIGALYEKEVRSLKESRDISLKQKDEAIATSQEDRRKYEELLKELNQTHFQENTSIVKLKDELQEKTALLQRKQLTQTEVANNLQEKTIENEKLKTKVEVLSEELKMIRSEMQQKQIQLESELADRKARLEVYEKLEHELDEVVNQAAMVTDELKAEEMIKTYTHQMVMPTSSKARLLQSVSLTRRTLQQEREIQFLKKELDSEKEKSENFSKELSKAHQMLDQTHQPYSYLIASIREKDSRLQEQHAKLTKLKAEMEEIRKENESLSKEHDRLAADLEKLLSNRNEIDRLKQLLSSIYMGHHNQPQALVIHQDSSEQDKVEMSTEFPEWFRKLKNK